MDCRCFRTFYPFRDSQAKSLLISAIVTFSIKFRQTCSGNITCKASADKFATRCLGNLQSLPIIFDVFVIHTRDAIKRDFSRSFTIRQIARHSRSKEGEQKLFSMSKRLTIKRFTEKGHSAFRDLNQTA